MKVWKVLTIFVKDISKHEKVQPTICRVINYLPDSRFSPGSGMRVGSNVKA